MPSPSVVKIAKAKEVAAEGVDYSSRYGARCPWCGMKTKVVNTQPWEESIRIRFHKCQNEGCVLFAMGVSIKSIQVEQVVEQQGSVIG